MAATIRRDDFIATLRRVMILVADRARAVRFAFSEDELEIEVHNVDRGEVREQLMLELEGEAMTVGFNARFVQEVLSVIDSDVLVMEQSNPLAPCMVRDPENPEAFFVVMPMRLD